MKRRDLLRLAAVPAFVFLLRGAHASGPLLFHQHGHGLAFSSDGKVLFAPSRAGLAAYEDGAWWESPGPARGFSGFAVTRRAIYASGPAAGLMRSRDGGRSWESVALAGASDLPLIAAGHDSGAIYVLDTRPNPAMATAGIFLTRDEGKTWRKASSRGLAGEIHALAAHPLQTAVLAVGTGAGLFLSRNAGEQFARLDRSEPVTAVAFDHEGERAFYARALSNDVVDRALEGSRVRRLQLPALGRDYVTCLAHSPTDDRRIAFATRKLDVYLTRDGGRNWRRIASEGDAGAPESEFHRDHS